jgi:hypothetical protein
VAPVLDLHLATKKYVDDNSGGAGDLLADGTVPLTANWDVGAFTITALRFVSDQATGTAPFDVASTTVVANLNVDQVDGRDEGEFALLAGRSGDQTLIGGTASGEDLHLQSTAHATRGSIFFGANSQYDEVNDIFYINETANPKMAVGLTINQGESGFEILSLKNSLVAHGMTDDFETDTFAAFKTVTAATGGMRFDGFTEDFAAFQIVANYTNDNTTKTNAGRAAIEFYARKKSGTSQGAPGANANLFIVRNNNTTKFMVDNEGDLFADGGAGSTDMVTLFDEYDDAQLVRAFDIARGGRGLIRDQWDEFLDYGEDKLVELGILGAPIAEGGLVNLTGLQRLHNGAIWQLHTKIREQAVRIETLERKLLEA